MNLALPGLGLRVRAARERRGLSREAVAFHSGLSWSAVTQVETGRRRNIRPQTLSALAGALGVTLDYLVHGVEPQTPLFEHQALLYGNDEEFLSTAGAFLMNGVELGEPALVVTSPRNMKLVRGELGAAGKRVQFAEAEAWYSSPAAALRAYKRFVDAHLEGGASWVRVVGEPVWVGRSASEVRRWTTYESLLNLVFASSAVTVMCPYDRRSLPPKIVRQAHETHPHTVYESGVAESSDYADPCTFVLER